MVDLHDIQGDILLGMQKDHENFIFFKIAHAVPFRRLVNQYVGGRITAAQEVHQREATIRHRKRLGQQRRENWQGLNLGFTKDGLTQLLGAHRPKLDPAFERGADSPKTIQLLNDPPSSTWIREFASDRIDGVFLVTGPDRSAVTMFSN